MVARRQPECESNGVCQGASARIAVVRSDYSASNLSVPGHGRGRSGIGALPPLPGQATFDSPKAAVRRPQDIGSP
jgi:hypothetical protein